MKKQVKHTEQKSDHLLSKHGVNGSFHMSSLVEPPEAPGEVVSSMDSHSHSSARCYQKMKGTVIGQTECVEVCWWDREFPGPTTEENEKVGPVRWTNDFWNATCVSSYLCFLLQYTKRLSKRKNTRSWIFPEEIFSRTPHMSISVQVSVTLDPWIRKKRR